MATSSARFLFCVFAIVAAVAQADTLKVRTCYKGGTVARMCDTNNCTLSAYTNSCYNSHKYTFLRNGMCVVTETYYDSTCTAAQMFTKTINPCGLCMPSTNSSGTTYSISSCTSGTGLRSCGTDSTCTNCQPAPATYNVGECTAINSAYIKVTGFTPCQILLEQKHNNGACGGSVLESSYYGGGLQCQEGIQKYFGDGSAGDSASFTGGSVLSFILAATVSLAALALAA